MKLSEALKQIEELKRRVKELEARPTQQIHYHIHEAPRPIQPSWAPLQPAIYPCITYCNVGAAGSSDYQVLS